MSVVHYHLSPVILSDAVYTLNGGRTGTSTAAQRQVAYTIAESQMEQEIGTMLLPETVTGLFQFNYDMPRRYQLPHDRLIRVDAVTILSKESCCDCSLDQDSGCAFIVDNEYGYIDVKQMNGCLASACGFIQWPYEVLIAYTAGLPTGVAALDPRLHLALAIAADIALFEIIDPAANEGGPGDPGVNEFVNMGYGEKRVPLLRTTFGNSARANKAKQLVSHLRKNKALKLGL